MRTWLVVLGLLWVAVPARADTCKALGVGGTEGTRIAISTEVRPQVGSPLMLTLEVVNAVPQLTAKVKGGKAAATDKPAVFTFDGGAKESWTFTSPGNGIYVFTPLTAEQLDLLGKKPLLMVSLPLATGGHEDFALAKENAKTVTDGAKCVSSRLP
jgi:hypothetical protein